jgi:hypothetical protein
VLVVREEEPVILTFSWRAHYARMAGMAAPSARKRHQKYCMAGLGPRADEQGPTLRLHV